MTTNKKPKDFPIFIDITSYVTITVNQAEDLFLHCNSIEDVESELNHEYTFYQIGMHHDISLNKAQVKTAAEKIFKKLEPKRLKFQKKRKLQEKEREQETLEYKQRLYLRLKKELGYNKDS